MLHFASPDIGLFGRRLRHVRGHRIAVAIAGHDSRVALAADTAIVVDDFGADDVIPAGTGCACCTVRVRLQRPLWALIDERARGRHVARVMIESRNDPEPILRTFASERALGAEFYCETDPPPPDGTLGFTLTEDAPLRWDAFSRFIATLTALRGADLLHIKGLLNVPGCGGPVVVQAMRHLAHRPVELQAWPDEDRRSRVAFVTRGIEESAVRGLFDAVRALG